MTELRAWTAGPAKEEAVAEVGEPALVLPALVGRALEANGRAKYLLSLLQAARSFADHPGPAAPSLREERVAARVDDPRLDEVVTRSRVAGPGRYLVPGALRIHDDLVDAVAQMLAPLSIGDAETARDLDGRLGALVAIAPDLAGDLVPGAYVDAITSARSTRGDSFHQLVMEAHRALNRLQERLATSSVDGAFVYGLAAGDEELVRSFMAGVHATEPLRFDHPGLGTCATRAGTRLLIQNDLGTTSAHVVVLAVEDRTATLTHTDVHLRRLRFFQSLLEGFGVHWSDAERRTGSSALGEHHLAVGRYEAPDRARLEAFLSHVGSRLVFLLDWNRARKRLATFLPMDDAVSTLRWAADADVGHLGFLALGGERLIYDAVELSATVPARYGEPLVEVLGRDAVLAITRFALRAATEGLRAGKSPLLIRDELRVEVLRHAQALQQRLLDATAEHARLVVDAARALDGALVRLGGPEGAAFLGRATRRAAAWEHQADQILIRQRQEGRRVEGRAAITAVTATADDAVDLLEEAIFLLTLLPDAVGGLMRSVLGPVAAIALATAREHLKAVEIARQVLDGAVADDMEAFLVAVDRIATLEHDADAADRAARAALVTDAPEFRSLYVADGVSRDAEAATDALLRSVLGLRDHILSVASTR